ncbi:MAG TPA: DeoR/GlpR family DNA-binding transcription regulator [Ktedonobacteraceae bacterium]|jgi:DeoR/GlpR family transcriptional regulator of sugar metabolism|nr:DeoR/GlpR family DNA-binding transcription regulator [Ktedonobacteraceae bacterium]
MLKEERQRLILETLQLQGTVLASALSERLNVSEDTIRRDLKELADSGILQRVHGGAMLRLQNVDYTVRREQAQETKIEIARATLSLIRNGQVIIMDGGTTTLQVARHLPRDLHATIITNSPPIVMVLAEYPALDVIVVGGSLYKPSLVSVGVEAVEALRSVRADLCLLGICSLHPEIGISVPEREELYTKRAMIASSAEVVALASAEKLYTVAPYVVGPLQDLTYLVTENAATAEQLAPYEQLGISIIRGSQNPT